ncbi:MAG: asparagine--tRNA ligase [Thermoplasmata archaeon]
MARIKEILQGKHSGRNVNVHGWIHRTRSSGGLVFIVIRDSSGLLQVTVNKEAVSERAFSDARSALVESSVEVSGEVVEDKRAPGGYEIRAKDFRVISFAEKFPISKDRSEEFLLDVRHLWVRSQKMTNVLKVRSSIFGAIHDYFRTEGFHETQSPSFTPSACEGGSSQFEVDYFGRKVYLTQSWQLYAEATMMGLEKIYTVAPSFRAEKSRTTRHLTEYWHAEAEMAWMGMDEAIEIGENLISHICQRAAEEMPDELKALGRDPEDMRRIRTPFPKMKYSDAVEKLREAGVEAEWGKDLRTIEERKLMAFFDKPAIVTHYPREVMAFYKRVDPENPELTLAFDFIAPEIGDEIIGGSERENDIGKMRENLIRDGENASSYEWYFDTRRYGAVPHSGFGMGIDRMVQWICKLKHIRDAIPFPRTLTRSYP